MNTHIKEKFFESINKTNSCWNWIGFVNKSGLPIIRDSSIGKLQEFSARRIALQLHNLIYDENSQAIPWCKNKLCVNPDHLAIGDKGRFWSKVQKLSGNDGCWIWIASEDKNGYGKFKLFENGKKIDVRAHRYSWELYTGRKIPENILLCHRCDRPRCVNPSHLFLGTNNDNVQDRCEKRRSAKGEKSGSAKLTEDRIKEIRELHKTGISITKLSKIYCVAQSTMSAIINRKTWTHL